jgi:hypothetical protein
VSELSAAQSGAVKLLEKHQAGIIQLCDSFSCSGGGGFGTGRQFATLQKSVAIGLRADIRRHKGRLPRSLMTQSGYSRRYSIFQSAHEPVK